MFERDAESDGDFEGGLQRGRVLVLFDGDDGLAGSTISGARTDSPFQNKKARAEGGLFSFFYLSLE